MQAAPLNDPLPFFPRTQPLPLVDPNSNHGPDQRPLPPLHVNNASLRPPPDPVCDPHPRVARLLQPSALSKGVLRDGLRLRLRGQDEHGRAKSTRLSRTRCSGAGALRGWVILLWVCVVGIWWEKGRGTCWRRRRV